MKRKFTSIIIVLLMTFTLVGTFPVSSYAEYATSIEGFEYGEYLIPAYDGDMYEVINGNDPEFAASEIVADSYESYSALDELGRVGEAQACLSTETMPADDEKRGDISDIFPTGWIQAKYAIVPNSWLYNRCHLIGWQLSAENDNKRNLMTGTRSFNVDGMLPFENMVADYIKETDNHVMYRVTPVFLGDNLLATGVLIEAESVEDDEIEFCVFCYNLQKGISIDYEDGSSCLTTDVKGNRQLSDCKVTLNTTSYVYNGYTKKPSITVKDGTIKLTKDIDYVVSYSNNTNVGTAKATITGIGNYTGKVTKTFTIKQQTIANVTYSISNQTYTGKTIKPSAIIIKQGSRKLVKGTDFSITSYGTNKNTGKGFVTVKGKGNYKDSKKLTFYIVPKKPSVSLTSVQKSSIKLKWTNVAGESGYQVAYKKSAASTYKTSFTTKTAKNISGLTAGSNYNVKVRAYKTVNGVKKYGDWSKVKTYKTKGKAASTSTTKTVYITATGTKYHLNKNCRGLSKANSIMSISLSKAKAQGYTLCGYED